MPSPVHGATPMDGPSTARPEESTHTPHTAHKRERRETREKRDGREGLRLEREEKRSSEDICNQMPIEHASRPYMYLEINSISV